MSRPAVIPGLLLFVGTLLPGPARADSIPITSGSLTSVPGGAAFVHLESGTRLTLDAEGGNGRFEPWDACRGTPDTCGPGDRISLLALWSGSDFTGTATLDGRTFRLGLVTDETGEAFVEFTGSFVAPLFTGGDQVSIVAPFAFSGFLFQPRDAPGPATISLTGRGTARVELAWDTNTGGAWLFQNARYDFEAVADPIPEPATMLLVGSGIAGCVAAPRRRRRLAG